ncbi:unnamed protein product [Phyllotreta striolata]|uniref:Uncharacterized protein n=1 Tax=Phyllotreta striolata TaxID=444603 RepID=A0A9N9XTN4_PHYSR|nr:unnamed protein product [Phyllotreta striolata]
MRSGKGNPFHGPNTFIYEYEAPERPHPAPFLVSARRDFSHLNPNYCESHIYGVRDDMKDRRMGTSPSNAAPRVLHDISPGAPVTNYIPKEPACPGAFDNKDKKKLPKFYTCRVTYNALGEGASVPSHIHKYGYYMNGMGQLKLVPTDHMDRSGGPAKYGSNMKKTIYDEMYKGIKFPTSPREQRKYPIPGPADYSRGDVDFHKDPVGDQIRSIKRWMTYIPRYIENLQLEAINGPPSPTDFDTVKPLCQRSPPINPLPFVTSGPRFPPIKQAPDHYDIVQPTYPANKLEVSFLKSAERFVDEKPTCLSGPFDYDVPSPIDEKLYKGMAEAAGKPPFGQGAKRLLTVPSSNPGPADYGPIAPKREKKTRKQPTVSFRSKTKRWTSDSYPKWDYLKVADAHDFVIKGRATSLGGYPFNVGSKRAGYFDMLPTPPFTKYCNKPELTSKGFYIPQALRFPKPRDIIPAPDAYLIHPTHTSSMYNAFTTHNLKLKEAAARMAFRVNPKDTDYLWRKERSKKKKMKWFYKDGKDYVHCVKDMKPYKGK